MNLPSLFGQRDPLKAYEVVASDSEPGAAVSRRRSRLQNRLSAVTSLMTTKILVLILLALCAFIVVRGINERPPHALQGKEDIAAATTIVKVTMLVGSGNNLEKGGEEGLHNLAGGYRRALATHKRHATLQGYRQIVQTADYVGKEAHPLLNKLAALLSVVLQELEKREEVRARWLFWHDMDTILLNPTIPLDIFLPPDNRTDLHFLAANDLNGLNDGVFFLRVSSWSALFLSSALSMSKATTSSLGDNADQEAISTLLRSNDYFSKGYQQIPRHWINAYPTLELGGIHLGDPKTLVEPGYLLVHFVWKSKYLPYFGAYLDIAEKHDPLWENQMATSLLKEEASSFWSHIPQSIEAKYA